VAPAPHGGGHPHAIPDEALGLLLTLVEAHADATLEELRDDYQCCTDQLVGRSTIDRALDRLGLTRKKKVLRASERDRPDVQQRYEQFQQEVQQIPVEHLKFLDESGSHISLTRTHARAPRGQRVSDSVPRNRGRVETMLGLLSLQGMEGVMTVEGGTNKEVFVTFLKTQVLPRLQPKDVLVMDNLKAHRAPGIQELVEETGAKVLYMPPYSPELNPIEPAWSKVKALLRRWGLRDRESLRDAIVEAAEHITVGDALGWFLHCGYRAPPN
jgi:transposase